ncbi:hypothetical protein AWB79_00936 [Caballeronia hypogeia]|uniref:Uncharacterized protein n=1 Tax=Caballeronia hypogeia TaxID=1777140 RepID=A0A157ZHT5_9BURK|nr:hypothetical protein AWB79_00936 [Caballeronia hypogeia]
MINPAKWNSTQINAMYDFAHYAAPYFEYIGNSANSLFNLVL